MVTVTDTENACMTPWFHWDAQNEYCYPNADGLCGEGEYSMVGVDGTEQCVTNCEDNYPHGFDELAALYGVCTCPEGNMTQTAAGGECTEVECPEGQEWFF